MGSLGVTELVIYGAVVVLLGVLVWKFAFRVGPVQGFVMLQRWGIAEPTREQSEAAADYLRERRRLYPLVLIVLAILLTFAYRLAGQGTVGTMAVLLGALVGTLLVGELVAGLRRPASTARVATLVPRRLTDLVPRAWLAGAAAVFVLAAACVVPALGVQAWADDVHAWADRNPGRIGPHGVLTPDALSSLPRGSGAIWLTLALLVLVAVSVAAVVRLTLTRAPLAADAAVDSALRIRTARLATGTAVLLVLGLSGTLTERIVEGTDPMTTGSPPVAPGLPVLDSWLMSAWSVVNAVNIAYMLAGLVVWCGLISPWRRRQRLVEATR
ncbi:hypothetical protein SAMN05421678_104395 [Actinopolymorpha cephalotaxi]|uniref:Uncharacterized protein n=1 Tax=Actinopolymorpha cephalotaxi TaxID=504797 RepID=A0A1I2Q4B8_9ACTN|nr:hypothetical protein [Actinopolymorpha cephalotaxi]NYH83357.1 hypothetical protein [Actinopolymorpha cephalotaxi]SFG23222.1 hypothetical protein SAMN05421678_104395 [Actinopolymorpha cephalotaxi]